MDSNILLNMLKGLFVGGSMLIPGVSGGSMAMILGIYDKLITSVSSFFKHKKQSIIVLGTFVLGAGIGILLFAKPLLYLTDTFTFPMMYLFMGAVVGSIPMIYKKADIKKISLSVILYTILGMAIIFMISLIPEELFSVNLDIGVTDI